MKIVGLEIQFRINWVRRKEYNEMPHDEEIVKLFEQGMPQVEIANQLGINQATVSRRLKKYGKRKLDYRYKATKEILRLGQGN